MGIYFLRRLLLIIPTLLGVMSINFILMQLSPGGPIEREIAKIENLGHLSEAALGSNTLYKGSIGLDPEFIEEIKKLYGFDKPLLERYIQMLWNFARFDFGESFYAQSSVLSIIAQKLPVSISLGFFSTLLIYLISIPLGIAKAVRHGSKFDVISSIVIVVLNAIPAFMFGVVLIVLFCGGSYFDIFPLRSLVSDDFETLSIWGKIVDYLWHLCLPVLCISIGGLATLSMLSKNCFLEEIHKSYVVCARAKGGSELHILYGHIFRNAMLLIISGFPAVFIGAFFSGSLLIEVIFSLDGLGLLGYESVLNRDFPVVFGTLYIFTFLALVLGIITDMLYYFIDPRIHFEGKNA
ncbi:microcin C ABC transporter permease YejB [Helicobacter marmotae]|uniref:Microcin C ABC transporter permease YejB n=1 Tax=Helicobacter marmotae TaxID=152490 RepID=A0A3D8I1Z6_9HELI|nr:microcin C ABC transporter permease YejB [Helicobacter marmotae]RDU59163.1 microcin C ABC transporter permease YejB [Helicobacter marmotae]